MLVPSPLTGVVARSTDLLRRVPFRQPAHHRARSATVRLPCLITPSGAP
jgi:hypothetical protein